MTALAMSKPWIPLTAEEIAKVPAQLGVFEIGDEAGEILLIAYAGGTELFGLRSALDAARETHGDDAQFRYELTHGYLTRWEELLMVHKATTGELPPGNADHPHPLGRLAT